MMLITVSAFILVESISVYLERPIVHRILPNPIAPIAITLGRRYGISSSFIRIPLAIVLTFAVLIPDVSVDMCCCLVIMISMYLMILMIFLDSVCKNSSRCIGCLAWNTRLDSNDCTELPPEVVCEIVNRLPAFQDFIAAAGVSRTWRSACLSSSRSQLPGLMLSETLPTETRHCFSPSDNLRQFLLSEVHRKCSWGSPHGSVETHLLHQIGLESNEPQAPIRSELPADMIHEIGNRIPNFIDIKAILTFCNPCNSACLETTSWSLFPWLMLSDELDSDLRCFVNLCNNKCHRLELPTIHEKRCWGSPHGWVVTMGADYVSHLVHLMKGKLIDLPPLDTIRGLAGIDLEWFRLVHKFILFKDPSHNLSFLVIAIFGPMNSLAFTRVGGGAALNRRGQGEWVIVANPENLKFKDVACFNDQMYALCDHGKLVRFKLDALGSAEVQVISPPPEDLWEWELQKLYLVGTMKNLFSVFRYGHVDPLTSHKGHKTTSFLVYKFNFSASAWEEVSDLEDHAVFVGDGNSWCCPTSTIPSRSNCIYFTDDNWELYMHLGVAYGGSDVGVFDVKTSFIKPLTFCEDNPRFYSRITFIIPMVCLDTTYCCGIQF